MCPSLSLEAPDLAIRTLRFHCDIDLNPCDLAMIECHGV